MSDFYDGITVHETQHTPDGIAKGWVPIFSKKVEVVPVPLDADGNEIPVKYWKFEDVPESTYGKIIVEKTQAEKDEADAPPFIRKTAKDIYSELFDEFGVEKIINDLRPALTPFFDTCIRQESANGHALAKDEIDRTSLSDSDKNKIKLIIGE